MTATLATLIERDRVTATVKHGAMPRADFPDSDPWTVTLRRKGKRLTVPFYMGYGHKGAPPDAQGVIDCLLSDASGAEDSFESWCSDLGYDPDSRKAEATYKACQRIRTRLESFLGDSFEEYLYAER